MISQSRKWAPPKRNLRNRIGAIALLGMLASVGCDSLLDVTVPGRIASDRLEDPALAELTTRSVQAAWECALSQYAGASGLFGTELIHASNLGSRDNFGNRIYSVAETSGATNTCPTGDGLFSISGAPYAALALGRDVTLRYEAWTETELKNRARHIAYTATYTAYAMTILGEGFCQAVVESFGPALDPPDVFRAAETWFTKGLTFAETAGEAPARNLALVGRARVRLNLRNYDGAVADAERVPAGFVYNATRGTVLERVNRVWGETYRSRSMSVHPSFYNLTVGGVPDTRVRVQNMNARGADGITPSWFSLKNATADASVRAASWEEAQLIIAESRLGQIAVDRINAVRQKYALRTGERDRSRCNPEPGDRGAQARVLSGRSLAQ
jgi:hypothetical protein